MIAKTSRYSDWNVGWRAGEERNLGSIPCTNKNVSYPKYPAEDLRPTKSHD